MDPQGGRGPPKASAVRVLPSFTGFSMSLGAKDSTLELGGRGVDPKGVRGPPKGSTVRVLPSFTGFSTSL